jgi:tetratricopeptide (TPR) repeat protein
MSHPGARKRAAVRCGAHVSVGLVCNALGRYAEALTYLEESLAIAREIGDRTREAAVFQPLGLALEGLGDVAGARTYLDEAIVLARQIGNKREIAAALNNRAQLHRVQGELDAAQLLYEQVLALVREVGDSENEAFAQLNLAMVDIGREARDRARARLLDVMAIAEALGSKPAMRSVVEVSAGLAAASHEWERAGRFFGAAEAHAAATGLQRDPGDDAFLAPLIASARAISTVGRFDAAVDAGGALSLEEAFGEAANWIAEGARGPRAGAAS